MSHRREAVEGGRCDHGRRRRPGCFNGATAARRWKGSQRGHPRVGSTLKWSTAAGGGRVGLSGWRAPSTRGFNGATAARRGRLWFELEAKAPAELLQWSHRRGGGSARQPDGGGGPLQLQWNHRREAVEVAWIVFQHVQAVAAASWSHRRGRWKERKSAKQKAPTRFKDPPPRGGGRRGRWSPWRRGLVGLQWSHRREAVEGSSTRKTPDRRRASMETPPRGGGRRPRGLVEGQRVLLQWSHRARRWKGEAAGPRGHPAQLQWATAARRWSSRAGLSKSSSPRLMEPPPRGVERARGAGERQEVASMEPPPRGGGGRTCSCPTTRSRSFNGATAARRWKDDGRRREALDPRPASMDPPAARRWKARAGASSSDCRMLQ